MKKLILILFCIYSSILFCQNKNYNPIFIDKCLNKVVKLEFSIDSFPKVKFISIYVEKKDDWVSNYFEILNLKKDTIFIPRILLSTGNELHSKRWKYFNCNKIANNLEIDYYNNGNKRLEGKFIDGIPIEIIEYEETGIIDTKTFFKFGSLRPIRINYFDFKGDIYEYEIYKHRRRKTIIKRYNRNNKLISKEIEKH